MVHFGRGIWSLAAVCPLSVAYLWSSACSSRLHYCGKTLLSMGDNYRHIEDALRVAGLDESKDFINDSLFYCTGEKKGEVIFQAYCGVCTNNGFTNNDYCPVPPKALQEASETNSNSTADHGGDEEISPDERDGPAGVAVGGHQAVSNVWLDGERSTVPDHEADADADVGNQEASSAEADSTW